MWKQEGTFFFLCRLNNVLINLGAERRFPPARLHVFSVEECFKSFIRSPSIDRKLDTGGTLDSSFLELLIKFLSSLDVTVKIIRPDFFFFFFVYFIIYFVFFRLVLKSKSKKLYRYQNIEYIFYLNCINLLFIHL